MPRGNTTHSHVSGWLYSSITCAFLLVMGGLGTRIHETNGKIFFPKKTGIKIKTNLHQARQQPLGGHGNLGTARRSQGQSTGISLLSGKLGEANAQTQLDGDRDSAQCQGRDIGALPAAARALSPAANGMLEASKASLALLCSPTHSGCAQTWTQPPAPCPADPTPTGGPHPSVAAPLPTAFLGSSPHCGARHTQHTGGFVHH